MLVIIGPHFLNTLQARVIGMKYTVMMLWVVLSAPPAPPAPEPPLCILLIGTIGVLIMTR
jgi:hypothetical protein